MVKMNGKFMSNKKFEQLYMGLYVETKKLKPNKIVELGTGCGSCTVAMARTLQEIDNGGSIVTYEFERPTAGSGMGSDSNVSELYNRFTEIGLNEIVKLNVGDVFKTWVKNPTDFDLLYIDLDNTWDKVYDVIMGNEFITSKIKEGATVFIEGGHPSHPRMNQSTLNDFNNKKGKEIFTFECLHGDRISLSKLTIV